MTGLLTRLLVCPSVVYLSSVAFGSIVYFPSWYQIIAVGVVLAIAGYAMKVWLLNKMNIWYIVVIDFVAAAIIVYLSGFVFSAATITLLGALLTAFLLAITEAIQLYFRKSGEKV